MSSMKLPIKPRTHRLTTGAMTLAALATVIATACTPLQAATSARPAAAQTTVTATTAVTQPAPAAVAAAPASSVPAGTAAQSAALTVDPAAAPATTIRLGDAIAVEGVGATVNGNTVTISAGGIYRLSGTLADGQVVVAAKSSETVQLTLDGVDLASSTNAPIYVKSAKSASIALADGSQNRLVDGVSRPPSAEEPNAALYSEVDLTIGGSGALTVDGRFNDGIASKDDLTVENGSITVTSVADGVRGRDRLDIAGGTIAVTAGKDGLKSSNDEDPERGVVSIAGGLVQVTAGGDGIQAETDVAISGGTLAITSGGGSSVTPSADVSAKGIKASVDVTITGGTITVDSADDAVHSNGSLAVRGGTLTLASADDGMHADATLEIAGGDVTITRSYEGIESARIAISDGTVRVSSRDDGLNVAGGADSSAVNGRPGQNSFSASTNNLLSISGGYVVVDSIGDGLDANGAIEMSGGTVVVHGPAERMNGAIDYDRGFTITGGTLIAAGSAGMAQAPGTTSTQPSVLVTLPAAQPAGAVFQLGTASGEALVTFAPNRAYQFIVVSSAELEQGMDYVVQAGGSATGAATDGLYADGAYSGGAQAASFTVAGAVTQAGTAPMGPGGRGAPRR
jgi:hypothetical protein